MCLCLCLSAAAEPAVEQMTGAVRALSLNEPKLRDVSTAISATIQLPPVVLGNIALYCAGLTRTQCRNEADKVDFSARDSVAALQDLVDRTNGVLSVSGRLFEPKGWDDNVREDHQRLALVLAQVQFRELEIVPTDMARSVFVRWNPRLIPAPRQPNECRDVVTEQALAANALASLVAAKPDLLTSTSLRLTEETTECLLKQLPGNKASLLLKIQRIKTLHISFSQVASVGLRFFVDGSFTEPRPWNGQFPAVAPDVSHIVVTRMPTGGKPIQALADLRIGQWLKAERIANSVFEPSRTTADTQDFTIAPRN